MALLAHAGTEKEALAIARRRQLEEERKARIFNAKQRTIGVDRDILAEQIREKMDRQMREEELERQYSEELLRRDRELASIEHARDLERRRLARELNEFRERQQREMRASPPPVGSENTPSPANPLQLAGEDLSNEERKRRQQQQMKEWVAQQTLDKARRQQMEEEEQRRYEEYMLRMAQKTAELEEHQNRMRAEIAAATRDYNMKMAEEKRKMNSLRKSIEKEQESAEVVMNLSGSGLLGERKDESRSPTNPRKIVPYAYRGMTDEERAKIYEELERQRKEKEAQKEREKEEQKQWEMHTMATSRALLLRERELERKRAMLSRELSEEHLRMAKEKEKLKSSTPAEPVVTDDFFVQFGRSAR